MSFAKIPVTYVSMADLQRGRADRGVASAEDDLANFELWFDEQEEFFVPDDVAQGALADGLIDVVGEVSSARPGIGLDGAVKVSTTLDYDLVAKDTVATLSTEGTHMVVRPAINEANLTSMITSESVESFAKNVQIKLPRLTTGLLGSTQSGPTYNQFEALRWAVARQASQADYGARLHNLARVVCHSFVVAACGMEVQRTPYMATLLSRTLLTAETPNLPIADFEQDCWLYISDELDPTYRAFLVMGVKGLHHYAGANSSSVYSRLVSDPEVTTERITFVRKSGELPAVTPGVGDYVSVLQSPEICLAYYYAYANSFGIGHAATQVLCQVALGPHIWGDRATLPYRPGVPKLDAATYLLRPADVAPPATIPRNFKGLVLSGPVIAAKFLAGVGAVVTSFGGGRAVSVADVMAQVVGVMSNHDQARALLRRVWAHVCSGYLALEWVNPFQTHVPDAHDACVRAFREGAVLLAQHRSAPVASMAPLFSGGVDMQDAMIGGNYRGDADCRYNESLIYQVVAGMPLQCKCEAYTAGMYGPRPDALGLVRSWCAVISWVRYSSKNQRPADKHTAVKPAPPPVEPRTQGADLGFLHRMPQTRTSEEATVRPTRPAHVAGHGRTASGAGGHGSVGSLSDFVRAQSPRASASVDARKGLGRSASPRPAVAASTPPRQPPKPAPPSAASTSPPTASQRTGNTPPKPGSPGSGIVSLSGVRP